jgi:hypothetical protein
MKPDIIQRLCTYNPETYDQEAEDVRRKHVEMAQEQVILAQLEGEIIENIEAVLNLTENWEERRGNERAHQIESLNGKQRLLSRLMEWSDDEEEEMESKIEEEEAPTMLDKVQMKKKELEAEKEKVEDKLRGLPRRDPALRHGVVHQQHTPPEIPITHFNPEGLINNTFESSDIAASLRATGEISASNENILLALQRETLDLLIQYLNHHEQENIPPELLREVRSGWSRDSQLQKVRQALNPMGYAAGNARRLSLTDDEEDLRGFSPWSLYVRKLMQVEKEIKNHDDQSLLESFAANYNDLEERIEEAKALSMDEQLDALERIKFDKEGIDEDMKRYGVKKEELDAMVKQMGDLNRDALDSRMVQSRARSDMLHADKRTIKGTPSYEDMDEEMHAMLKMGNDLASMEKGDAIREHFTDSQWSLFLQSAWSWPGTVQKMYPDLMNFLTQDLRDNLKRVLDAEQIHSGGVEGGEIEMVATSISLPELKELLKADRSKEVVAALYCDQDLKQKLHRYAEGNEGSIIPEVKARLVDLEEWEVELQLQGTIRGLLEHEKDLREEVENAKPAKHLREKLSTLIKSNKPLVEKFLAANETLGMGFGLMVDSIEKWNDVDQDWLPSECREWMKTKQKDMSGENAAKVAAQQAAEEMSGETAETVAAQQAAAVKIQKIVRGRKGREPLKKKQDLQDRIEVLKRKWTAQAGKSSPKKKYTQAISRLVSRLNRISPELESGALAIDTWSEVVSQLEKRLEALEMQRIVRMKQDLQCRIEKLKTQAGKSSLKNEVFNAKVYELVKQELNGISGSGAERKLEKIHKTISRFEGNSGGNANPQSGTPRLRSRALSGSKLNSAATAGSHSDLQPSGSRKLL